MSAATNCRVCAQPLFPDPLLCYRNMPAAAQGFPDAGAVAGDVGRCEAVSVIVQAPGFGTGEAFTNATFTGKAQETHIALQEMEVFAVRGYP